MCPVLPAGAFSCPGTRALWACSVPQRTSCGVRWLPPAQWQWRTMGRAALTACQPLPHNGGPACTATPLARGWRRAGMPPAASAPCAPESSRSAASDTGAPKN
eukprot:2674941-Prymnesium_polylepis.2